ncbi:hypothetical protein [Pararhodobacter sp. SW119]|uniref:hypothetical protein n=1 Tax=Pararhodobacter sp. SW119 TaxID=2780075 RepID=UPI001ADED7F6|nr:hypothetical protein [Pararhodobacter sp. SW119]
MTALKKYKRLEGPAVWRADPDAQRRDVVISLGKSSLVITDSRSGAIVSHWSLPALVRLNPGREPAVYAAGPDEASEIIEIDDLTLIEAFETIRAALRPRVRLRHLRKLLVGLSILAVALAAWLWMPPALVDHTAAIVPPAKRAEVGRAALADLTLADGGPRLCTDPAGRQALTTLRLRVLGPGFTVAVLSGGAAFGSAHLPGRLVVIDARLLDRLDSAEALAGYLLAEEHALLTRDPMRDVLSHAGTLATFRLLITGNLPDPALAGYAAQRFAASRPPADAPYLAERFAAIGVSPAAFAVSLPPGFEALTRALADTPAPTDQAPLLSDGEWLTLTQICQTTAR